MSRVRPLLSVRSAGLKLARLARTFKWHAPLHDRQRLHKGSSQRGAFVYGQLQDTVLSRCQQGFTAQVSAFEALELDRVNKATCGQSTLQKYACPCCFREGPQ